MNAITYVKKMTLLKIKSVVKVKCCSGSEQGKSGVTILNKHPLEKLFRKFWCGYFGLCFCFFFVFLHLHLLHTCGQLLLQTFYFHRHDLSLYNFFYRFTLFEKQNFFYFSYLHYSYSLQLFHDGGPYHLVTSPLIYRANQLTSFYMIRTFFMK